MRAKFSQLVGQTFLYSGLVTSTAAGSKALKQTLITLRTLTIARLMPLAVLSILGFHSLGHAQVVNESSYVLDSGDRIAIQVFDEQDLSMEAVIDSNGIINYSFLGALEVGGRTTEQIEQRITELLRDGYLVNPSVNVTVTGYRLFYISGEVRSPGGYPYVPGLNLEQAVAMAGGLTDRASKRKMYLIKGNSTDKRRSRVKLNASIDPGDTITIEEGFF